LRVVLGHGERADAVEEAFRPEGVAGFAVIRTVACLRNESLIGAEIVAVVLEFRIQIDLRIRVRPPEIAAERLQLAAIPFAVEIGRSGVRLWLTRNWPVTVSVSFGFH